MAIAHELVESITTIIIISEPDGITSMDCDRDSGMLVACSVLGGLWRLPMS